MSSGDPDNSVSVVIGYGFDNHGSVPNITADLSDNETKKKTSLLIV